MSGELPKAAYDLAIDQLRRQKEDLKYYRGQASICAAVTGLIATVFVGLAATSQTDFANCTDICIFNVPLASFAAASLFALSVFCAVSAVVSWQRTVFDLDPEVFLHHHENDGSLAAAHVKLARLADTNFDKNEDVIEDTKLKLTVSFLLGWAQIPAWLVAIF